MKFYSKEGNVVFDVHGFDREGVEFYYEGEGNEHYADGRLREAGGYREGHRLIAMVNYLAAAFYAN